MVDVKLANGETVTICQQTGRTRLQFDTLFKVAMSAIAEIQNDLQVDDTQLLTLVYHYCVASVRCDGTGEFDDILAPLSATDKQFISAFTSMLDNVTSDGLDYVMLVREVNKKIDELDRPTSEKYMQPLAGDDPN